MRRERGEERGEWRRREERGKRKEERGAETYHSRFHKKNMDGGQERLHGPRHGPPLKNIFQMRGLDVQGTVQSEIVPAVLEGEHVNEKIENEGEGASVHEGPDEDVEPEEVAAEGLG
jgi:hypothetical protein